MTIGNLIEQFNALSPYTVVFIAVAIVLAVLYIIEKVTGNQIYPYILTGRPVLGAATMLAKAVSATTTNPYFKMVATVMEAATNAAQKAENMWLIGEIDKTERRNYAYELITGTLTDAGIEMNDQINDIITGTIAIVAALLPHGLAPKGEIGDEPV